MTPFLWGLVAGWLASHLFYAAIFVIVWYRYVRRAGEPIRKAVQEDFTTIREGLLRAGSKYLN